MEEILLLKRISRFSNLVSRRRTSSAKIAWSSAMRDHLGSWFLPSWREYRDVKKEIKTKLMATKAVKLVTR